MEMLIGTSTLHDNRGWLEYFVWYSQVPGEYRTAHGPLCHKKTSPSHKGPDKVLQSREDNMSASPRLRQSQPLPMVLRKPDQPTVEHTGMRACQKELFRPAHVIDTDCSPVTHQNVTSGHTWAVASFLLRFTTV